jgi:hypothetical protein
MKKAVEGCSRLRRDGDFSFVSFLCMAGKEKNIEMRIHVFLPRNSV